VVLVDLTVPSPGVELAGSQFEPGEHRLGENSARSVLWTYSTTIWSRVWGNQHPARVPKISYCLDVRLEQFGDDLVLVRQYGLKLLDPLGLHG
jgi:hypothetical protein